jgi:hypothetical protein
LSANALAGGQQNSRVSSKVANSPGGRAASLTGISKWSLPGRSRLESADPRRFKGMGTLMNNKPADEIREFFPAMVEIEQVLAGASG